MFCLLITKKNHNTHKTKQKHFAYETQIFIDISIAFLFRQYLQNKLLSILDYSNANKWNYTEYNSFLI